MNSSFRVISGEARSATSGHVRRCDCVEIELDALGVNGWCGAPSRHAALILKVLIRQWGIPERVALATAVAAGQDGIEHFGRVTMACSTAEERMLEDLRDAMAEEADLARIFAIMAARNRIILETWDATLCAGILRKVAAAGVHVSPTFVVAGFYTGERPGPDTLRMRMLPTEVREAWEAPDFRLEAMTDEVRALAGDSIALDRRTFLMAHRVGVPILASSDASFANPFLFHGFSLLDELDLYVEIGLTPREALHTATLLRISAKALEGVKALHQDYGLLTASRKTRSTHPPSGSDAVGAAPGP